MFKEIEHIIALTEAYTISTQRKEELKVLIDFIANKRASNKPVELNFICTHNSRRSQFTQIWAAVAANHFNIDVQTHSGGVEITACNERTIASLKRFGFEIDYKEQTNPHYKVTFNKNTKPTDLYSKLYNDEKSPNADFAAIMTCSHADENCPFVPGCEQRISLRYDDPKAFDDTPYESTMYDARSFLIASEMIYVFSQIK